MKRLIVIYYLTNEGLSWMRHRFRSSKDELHDLPGAVVGDDGEDEGFGKILLTGVLFSYHSLP
jgi:hypothetical protein